MKKSIAEHKLLAATVIRSAGLLLVLCGQAVAIPVGQSSDETQVERVDEKIRGKVQEAYGNLPLSFVENRGQVDQRVAFYSKALDHTVYFSKQGVTLNLSGSGSSAVVGLVPIGGNENSEIVGERQMAGLVNYLVGKDASAWKTRIPTYETVVYKEIYPGVDLKLYGNKRQLEYDFILQPGVNPAVVALSLTGVQGIAILDNGDLEIVVGKEKLIEKKPVIYQHINGQRIEIAGAYKLLAKQDPALQKFGYGFEVGPYDNSQPLIIDPVLTYSTYLGGKRLEFAASIAVDKLGYAYVGGHAVSDSAFDATQALGNFPGFPVTSGVIQTHHASFKKLAADGFVSKFSLDGSKLVYSTYLGGEGDPKQDHLLDPGIPDSVVWNSTGADSITGIAVDSDGNAFVTGHTFSSGFPVTAGAYQHAISQGVCGSYAAQPLPCAEAFVTKLNQDGSALIYSTYIGGTSDDRATGIALDDIGNAYVTGYSASDNFPTTPGAVQRKQKSRCPVPDLKDTCIDAFVFKLNRTGSDIIYSTLVGGSDNDQSNGIALDANANVYIAGITKSVDFPTTKRAYKRSRGKGSNTAFVTKLDKKGTRLAYSTYLGGNDGSDTAQGIAVSAAGNAYVVGFTDASDFPVTQGVFGAVRHTGKYDAFVTKLDNTGSTLAYSSLLGGGVMAEPVAGPKTPVYNYGYGIAIDKMENAYVVGITSAVDFPLANPLKTVGFVTMIAGTFITKINPTATLILFSTRHDDSHGKSIAVDRTGNIYFAGNSSGDHMPLARPIQNAHAGGGDAFVAKISMDDVVAK